MNKKFQTELKKKLKEQKETLEQELSKFAEKDKELKGDWDTKYPKADGATGGSALEDAADQVEAYANLLPVEYNMELRLKDINLALDKIEKSTFGKCEKCKKQIAEERLKVYPEARYCLDCDKK